MPLDLQPTLMGDLLTLRPIHPADWDDLFAAAADPLIWAQHPEHDRWTAPVFRRFFDGALTSGGGLVAIDRKSGAMIGSSRYFGYDPTTREVEIGWSFLTRPYWGGVYNGEMKRLMLLHAFPWVDRVLFIIGPENRRSRRAVEKLGGTLHATSSIRGEERVIYALTAAQYAAATGTPRPPSP